MLFSYSNWNAALSNSLLVFKVNASLTKPLTPVAVVKTIDWVYKILNARNELVLGEGLGYLEVFDIKKCNITQTIKFTEADYLNDIVAIDESNYLLGANKGL